MPSGSAKPSTNPKPSPSQKRPGPSPKPLVSATPSGPKPSPSPRPPGASPTPPRVVIILVSGGYYVRHGCYWYPAWGYDPAYSYYPYDGPIYSCTLPPDQMVANVQAALQSLGYYHGPINGFLDSATRVALADYQRDNGLYETSAVDESTLAALGMA